MKVCKRCTGGFEKDEGVRSLWDDYTLICATCGKAEFRIRAVARANHQSAEFALNPRYGKFRWAKPPI